MGSSTTASGYYSMAMGLGTTSKSYTETVLGGYNTVYTPLSSSTWNAADRLFVIGNGTGAGSESDAMVVLKNGNIGIGTALPKSRLQVSSGDVYIDDNTKGVIMKSPDGTCYRLTVANGGSAVFTAIACP